MDNKNRLYVFLICCACLVSSQATAVSTPATPKVVTRLSVDKPGKAQPGDVLTYTLNIANRGTGPARNVVLTDPIPAGTRYVTGSASSPVTEPEFTLDGGKTWSKLPFSISLDGGKSWRLSSPEEASKLSPSKRKEIHSGVTVTDGGRLLRHAPASLITHVRWVIPTLLPGAPVTLPVKVQVQ